MKYCKATTLQHPLAKRYPACLQELWSCIKQEGGKGTLFCHKEICINLDEVEKQTGRGDREATMDVTVGLSKEGKNREMLLVEFRFRYKSPRNISEANIRDKINHSRDLLEGTVSRDYIFIFTSNKNEARSHFNRLFRGKKVSCRIMDEDEFYATYFS